MIFILYLSIEETDYIFKYFNLISINEARSKIVFLHSIDGYIYVQCVFLGW